MSQREWISQHTEGLKIEKFSFERVKNSLDKTAAFFLLNTLLGTSGSFLGLLLNIADKTIP